MSNKNFISVDKNEVKIFVKRNYSSQEEFCKAIGINYNSFKNWLSGNDSLTLLAQKVINHIKQSNYNFNLIIKPGTRLDNETAREDLAVISSSNDSLSNLNKGLEEDIKNLIAIKTELEQKYRASERRLQFITTKYPHLVKQIKVA